MITKHIYLVIFIFVLGCLPNSAIVKQYDGEDAATATIFRDYNDIMDQYVLVDSDIASRLLVDSITEIKVSPGHHTLAAKSMQADMNAIPVRLKFEPKSIRYFRAYLGFSSSGVNLDEISRNEFAALMNRDDSKPGGK